MCIIENSSIALVPYSHQDDHDMYLCWQDIQTQKGYNYVFYQSFEAYQQSVEIERFKFWVTVIEKAGGKRIGVLRLGLNEEYPDLAIWIYPQYRRKGYGTEAFQLALEHLFCKEGYQTIYAGCYGDNIGSLNILRKIGFVPFPAGNETEVNAFTGEPTDQQCFCLEKASFQESN